MDCPYHKFARFVSVVGIYDPKTLWQRLYYNECKHLDGAHMLPSRPPPRCNANPFKYFAAKFVYTADHKYFFNVRYWRCCYDVAAFCNKFDSGKSFEVRGDFSDSMFQSGKKSSFKFRCRLFHDLSKFFGSCFAKTVAKHLLNCLGSSHILTLVHSHPWNH